MSKPKIGDIVRIKFGHKHGRDLPRSSIVVKVKRRDMEDSTRFYALPVNKKLSQAEYWYQDDEVVKMDPPKVKGKIIGEWVYQE